MPRRVARGRRDSRPPRRPGCARLPQAAEHATSRVQFGRTLDNFGLIKEKFGNMALDGYAIESMAYMTTGMIDRKDPDCYIEAAMCKVYGSEASWRTVNECIQVMGGMGFMTSWPFERAMRDSRILSIFEGTNEILRLMIALQGMRAVGDRYGPRAPHGGGRPGKGPR